MYYINYFFIFAIIGHLIETLETKGFNSGILYGWWTPVYGFGVIIILLIGKLINKFNFSNKKILKIFITYLLCTIILTLIELLGGYLIKWIWHTEIWNYENHKFNIGHYISLEISNIWGIAGIFVLYVLKPLFDKIINKIPKWLTYTLITLFTIDSILTLILK